MGLYGIMWGCMGLYRVKKGLCRSYTGIMQELYRDYVGLCRDSIGLLYGVIWGLYGAIYGYIGFRMIENQMKKKPDNEMQLGLYWDCLRVYRDWII